MELFHPILTTGDLGAFSFNASLGVWSNGTLLWSSQSPGLNLDRLQRSGIEAPKMRSDQVINDRDLGGGFKMFQICFMFTPIWGRFPF